jgi:hypothetical protein
MDFVEAFKVLGVSPDASEADIRCAYLDLVKVWHPDRFIGDARLRTKANAHLKLINAAYELLKQGQFARQPMPHRDSYPRPHNKERARTRDTATPPPPPPPPAAPPTVANPRGALFARLLDLRVVVGSFLVLAGTTVVLLLYLGGQADSRSEVSANKKLEPPPLTVTPMQPLPLTPLQPLPPATPLQPLVAVTPRQPLPLPETPLTAVPNGTAPLADPPAIASRRPLNGEEFGAGSDEGKGKLTIANGTDRDAVVMLHKGGDAERAIYVRARETAFLEKIAHSSYSLTFESGEEWSDEQRVFTRYVTPTDFLSALDFTEQREGNRSRWTTYRITLHPTADGNVRTARARHRPRIPPNVRVEGR